MLHRSYDSPEDQIDTGFEPSRPRLVIEKIQSREVARTYHLIAEDQEWDIRCIKPGADWDDPSNLFTKTQLIVDGPFDGQPSRIDHEDGMVSIYDYQIQGDRRVEIHSRGILQDGSIGELAQGTRRITIQGSAGQFYEQRTEDIASGEILNQILYSDHDPFHRPERIDYQDGTFERILHACCGPAHKRDREGRWVNLVYDSLKRPVYEITDEETKIRTYNAAGDMVRLERLNPQTQQLETLETHQYDLKGERITANHFGRQTTRLTSLNPRETITEQADGENRIELRARDGQLLEVTGTAQRGVQYDYTIQRDGTRWSRVTIETKLDVTNQPTREWVKTWRDMLGRIYKIKRADGALTTMAYNDKGQLITETDPDGMVILYHHNDLGERIETAIDLNGNGQIDYGVDRIQRNTRDVVKIQDVVYHRTRQYQWQTENNATPTLISKTLQSVDGLIRQQTFFPSQTQWLSTTTWQEGDPADPDNPIRTETTIHPDQTQTIRIYHKGLLITEQRLGSDDVQITRVDFTYDDQNRLITQTDAYAGTTEFEYDAQGRKTADIQPAPGPGMEPLVTRYRYDTMDRIITTRHPDGTFTQWIYHPENGQLRSKRYQDGKGPDYTWTEGGRLKTRTWARGVKTVYDYNQAGDLIEIDYKDRITPDVQYSYDRTGRKTTVAQGNDYLQTFTHDDMGKVLDETVTQPGLNTHQLTRAYDGAGRSEGHQWALDLDSMDVHYTYNPAGQLATVSDGDQQIRYEYLANTSRIAQITHQTQGQETMRTTKLHDKLGRLLEATTTRTADNGILSSRQYQYNQANQRTSVQDEAKQTWQYQANLLNQYSQSTSSDGSGSITRNYQHDQDGNLIQDINWDYEWNGENRLIAMESRDPQNQKRLEYRYDPQGRRITKTVLKPGNRRNTWQPDKQTLYSYNNWNLIAENDEYGNLIRTHLWGQDLSGTLQGAGGVGGLLATKDYTTATTHQPLYDANGNIVQFVNATTAAITAKYEYDPFGKVMYLNAAVVAKLPFQFSTKYNDGETGLSYYGFRYYNPETGRWLNRDPIGEDGDIGLYVFILNTPNNYIDFLGFTSLLQCHRILQMGLSNPFLKK